MSESIDDVRHDCFGIVEEILQVNRAYACGKRDARGTCHMELESRNEIEPCIFHEEYVCSECGEALWPEANYCPRCGARIEDDEDD